MTTKINQKEYNPQFHFAINIQQYILTDRLGEWWEYILTDNRAASNQTRSSLKSKNFRTETAARKFIKENRIKKAKIIFLSRPLEGCEYPQKSILIESE